MGSFSWYASDTNRAIRSDNPFPVYALQPNGGPLLEVEYEGYGVFGGQDIYDLVADWNRKYLAEHPEFLVLCRGMVTPDKQTAYLDGAPKRVDKFAWYPLYADLSNSRQEIEREMRENDDYWEYRDIGIDIACYNERNFSLPFPIKLVEQPVPYFAASASTKDPEQGRGEKDRFEDRAKTVSDVMASLIMQSAALAGEIIRPSDKDYDDQEEPCNSGEDLISCQDVLASVKRCLTEGKLGGLEVFSKEFDVAWKAIADFGFHNGDLVSRGELRDELMGHFGMDLACFGKDVQVFQEAVDLAPAVAPAIGCSLKDSIDAVLANATDKSKALVVDVVAKSDVDMDKE